MAKQKVVISVGGSILIPGKDDAVFIDKLAHMLRSAAEKVDMIVVVGGGKTARYYAETGRALGGDEYSLDLMGIDATRINARLLALALGKEWSSMDISPNVEGTVAKVGKVRIPVMGGTEPGHTTDAVSAMVAEKWKADRLVNATSVDAVYSEDPRKNPNAIRYTNLTIEDLGHIVYSDHAAGKSSVFDPLGVKIAEKDKIDIEMVDGRNLTEFEKAILGQPFSGTHIDSHH